MSVLLRVDNSNGRGSGPAAHDDSWVAAFPSLHEYLTEVVWPDGKPRIVATLLLLAEQGRFKVMVNDRANNRSAWFSGETVESCLEAAERGLSTGGVDWRGANPGRAGGGRR